MNAELKTRNTTKPVIERTYRATLQELWDLWTTKEGLESWWGPEGIRADVFEIEARPGGVLKYQMTAETPETIAVMKELGTAISNSVRARFVEFKPRERLVIAHVIDFIPGVAAYETNITVDFFSLGDRVRMVVTLDGGHTPEFTKMQEQGLTSQIGNLDKQVEKAARRAAG